MCDLVGGAAPPQECLLDTIIDVREGAVRGSAAPY